MRTLLCLYFCFHSLLWFQNQVCANLKRTSNHPSTSIAFINVWDIGPTQQFIRQDIKRLREFYGNSKFISHNFILIIPKFSSTIAFQLPFKVGGWLPNTLNNPFSVCIVECYKLIKVYLPNFSNKAVGYHKLRKTSFKLYRRHYVLVSKFNVGLKHFCIKAYRNRNFMVT